MYNDVRQKFGLPINILQISVTGDDSKIDKEHKVLRCVRNGSEFYLDPPEHVMDH